MDLVSDILAGNRLALARLLTQIENDSPAGQQALDRLFPHTGKAHLIGVTGAPGTGKSSLVNQLALYYRQNPRSESTTRVAIVAVDPSSPFTGGAILGDRIRMRALSGDDGVFIRSMASRGALGGIARTTNGLVQAFDAAGYDIIFIETVGAGQAEVDIARLAHTTLVVEAPGMGDDIQAIKAGILEIADILVVNKADHAGLESTVMALRNMLQLAHPVREKFIHHGRVYEIEPQSKQGPQDQFWAVPIQTTVATDGTGIPELVDQIRAHQSYLRNTDEWQARERLRLEADLENILQATLMARWRVSTGDRFYQETLARVTAREISPRQAALQLLDGA
ncbi:MAG: methylmalonyl Co-A mutase-associated GTPase MeaB [Anaerolineales bacterium]